MTWLACLLLICVSLVHSRTIDQKIAAAYKSDTKSNGDMIVEYDMVFERDVFERRMARMNADDEIGMETRKATRDLLWTNGVIPYKINKVDFSQSEINNIIAGMRDWESQTCLNFRPATASDRNYIFIKNDTGCNSYVGMGDGGSRQVSLDGDCRGKDTVIHELGHALGFEHEHQRPDRDGFIKVTKSNIKSNWTWALDKMKWTDVDAHNIAYDYSSIMHYGRTAFGKDKAGGGSMQTITTNDASWQYRIGTGQLPSFNDYKMANLIYKCAAKCPAKTCRNGGYLDKNCVCQCKGSPVHPCDDGKADGGGYDDSLKCKDVDADCAEFKESGYCKDSSYSSFMEADCRKTCGFC